MSQSALCLVKKKKQLSYFKIHNMKYFYVTEAKCNKWPVGSVLAEREFEWSLLDTSYSQSSVHTFEKG